jgi:hypothetical protein
MIKLWHDGATATHCGTRQSLVASNYPKVCAGAAIAPLLYACFVNLITGQIPSLVDHLAPSLAAAAFKLGGGQTLRMGCM